MTYFRAIIMARWECKKNSLLLQWTERHKQRKQKKNTVRYDVKENDKGEAP